MNFDYLKNIKGLDRYYYCCNNAEELAITKPDLSMVSARKSAEAVAKFVYLVAYSEEADYMQFTDILKDPVVKDYIKSKSVLDAFHYIRKTGNVAVHTLEEESPEEAVRVLKKLHYAVGEVAKRMRLVDHYPPFNENIEKHPDAELLDDEFYGNVAKDMYDEYMIYQYKIDVLKARYSELSAQYRFTHGHVDVNEVVEFKKRLKSYATIYGVQEYFGILGNQGLENIFKEQEKPYQLALSIYGEDGYTTNNLVDAVRGVLYDLPQAEGFRIASYYSGPAIVSLFEDHHINYQEDDSNEIIKKAGFYNLADSIDMDDVSCYKKFEFLYNHGSGGCMKYENGDWVDLRKNYSVDIVDRDFGQDWWCWSVDLVVDCDYKKHPEALQLLHDAVQNHVPEDQLEYCERNWIGDDSEPEILLDSIQWCPRTLREVQSFLDEINEIILPIKQECKCKFDGKWFITKDPMAEATCEWTNEGFKVIGTEL